MFGQLDFDAAVSDRENAILHGAARKIRETGAAPWVAYMEAAREFQERRRDKPIPEALKRFLSK